MPLTPHPLLGTWPTTQACALTGNQTSDLFVHRPALNPLSHTSQGWTSVIFIQNTEACVLACPVFVGQLCSLVGKNLDVSVLVSSFGLGTSLMKSSCSCPVGGIIREGPPS